MSDNPAATNTVHLMSWTDVQDALSEKRVQKTNSLSVKYLFICIGESDRARQGEMGNKDKN